MCKADAAYDLKAAKTVLLRIALYRKQVTVEHGWPTRCPAACPVQREAHSIGIFQNRTFSTTYHKHLRSRVLMRGAVRRLPARTAVQHEPYSLPSTVSRHQWHSGFCRPSLFLVPFGNLHTFANSSSNPILHEVDGVADCDGKIERVPTRSRCFVLAVCHTCKHYTLGHSLASYADHPRSWNCTLFQDTMPKQ